MSQGPYGESRANAGESSDHSQELQELTEKTQKQRRRGRYRRDQHYVVRDLILALSLCHNVTPVYPNADDPNEKEFQASSPDEIALVKFAEQLDMKLVDREELFIKLVNPNGEEEEYDILQNFPFSSESKRMGIIVQHR